MSRFLDEDDYGDYDDEQGGSDDLTPPPVKRRGSWLKNLLAIVVSLAVLIGGGYFVYTKVKQGYLNFTQAADYPGPGETDVLVEIPDGATLTDMGDVLVASDVVGSTKAFLNAAEDISGSSGIQPGTYQLKTKMSADGAVRALMDRSNMVNTQVTIPEGLRNTILISQLAEQSGIPEDDFTGVLDAPSELPLPDWAGGATEGMLFPDTYVFDTEPSATDVLADMVQQFDSVAEELDFENKAEALGITPYEALTVASIIEKETRDPKYGPDIAQVLYNRLDDGMSLQLDSTVIYAVNSSGTVTTSDEERADPSPYNTYVHEGLPPGAISNPGRSALEAAVNPTQGDYLYFVAVNPETGETKFASDSAGHDANVAEFQAWCQANGDACTGG
ncbi:endolytic transglycosylase MltG [Propionimicrobium sp. PCR01-08-3]|uniref:endolytic transglycosylase MltG n=1 Tax=Propionimicrobium sp. PCR01-08-3 TaxID=3052086 RepID=UPI00255CA58D|nr:endolytic transglycosylase MltG [Propionimicrobium sp. PCR01-08-3]WIY83891.1 endolytic transglycosylase MltG [Propionimicrobium sp. PCR01-08-3]